MQNWYKSAEPKNFTEKDTEYMLNHSLPCICSWNLSSNLTYIKYQ